MSIIQAYTVAALPPAHSMAGDTVRVTDSLYNPSVRPGEIVVGGGNTMTRVMSDGSNWRLYGWTGGRPGGAGTSIGDAFFNAVIALGGTISDARRTLYNNALTSIAAAGALQSKLDRLTLLAAENAASARVDLIDPTKTTTLVGAPTFTADQGYASIAGGNYVDTNATPATMTKYSQDSAFHAVGTLSTSTSAADVVIMGTTQLAGGSNFYLKNTAPGTFYHSNANSVFGDNGTVPAASVKGFYIGNRSASNAQQLYFNGAPNQTNTSVSATPRTESYILGAWRNVDATTVYAYDTGIVPVFALGASLTAQEALDLSTIINTYMTAVGNPLY